MFRPQRALYFRTSTFHHDFTSISDISVRLCSTMPVSYISQDILEQTFQSKHLFLKGRT